MPVLCLVHASWHMRLLWHLSIHLSLPPSLQAPWWLCIFELPPFGHSGASIIVQVVRLTSDFSKLCFFPPSHFYSYANLGSIFSENISWTFWFPVVWIQIWGKTFSSQPWDHQWRWRGRWTRMLGVAIRLPHQWLKFSINDSVTNPHRNTWTAPWVILGEAS